MKKKKLSLAAWIGIAMIAGIVVGAIMWLAVGAEAANSFATSYIKPFGDIFINLLKFIVVPVVLLSLIDGMISMRDIKKVGSIGIKTVAYFLCTTAIACIIGLALASLFKPLFPILTEVTTKYEPKTAGSFMDTIKGIFPSNMWAAFHDANMLQVIVIALFFGSRPAGSSSGPRRQRRRIQRLLRQHPNLFQAGGHAFRRLSTKHFSPDADGNRRPHLGCLEAKNRKESTP